uniref:Chromosome transmission fidelity protein 18 homolog n=1 Tax=Podarcis muralis TaxID=64176 RepID=A0A670JY31_PODMU
MEEDEHELYGIEDEFEEQFADELEALAELQGGEEAHPAPSHKVSEFRSRKRTFEEALAAGDLVKGSSPVASQPCMGKASQGQVLSEDGISNPNSSSSLMILLLVFPGPQRTHLEALGIPDGTGVSGMFPLHVTPPEEKYSRKVLKRPPILGDYINVTSTDGTRVFMVVKDDGMGTQVPAGPRSRALLQLATSTLFLSLLKLRGRWQYSAFKVSLPSCRCLGDEETQIEASAPSEEEGKSGAAEEDGEEAQGSLWVDRFAPRHYVELLSDDYTNRCLLKWLKLWDTVVFGKEKPTKKPKTSAEAHQTSRHPKEQQSKWKSKAQLTEEALEAELDHHNRPKYKVALLCGPPGLGKTTLAHVIVKHAGYNAVEMNASDDRSPDVFKTRIEAATQMKSVLGANEKPNCLIIDEIDGAPMASINVLLGIINRKAAEVESGGSTSGASGKKRRKEGGLLLRPIICICPVLCLTQDSFRYFPANIHLCLFSFSRYVPSLRLLRQQAFLLNFPSTAPSRLVQRLHEITVKQGMKADTGALLALCEKAENDIRSCINTLQFLHSRGKKELNARTVQTTQVGSKDQNKGLFSIWQEIFQLPKLTSSNGGDDNLFHVTSARASLNPNAQRFHHILHLSMSSGEHEKLTQGLYDNFLNMKIKDSAFDSLCLALEWLGFSDLVNKAVLHRQNFQLMRYLPFLPVAFHLLFAASSVPRLAYPNSQHEACIERGMQNLIASMMSGITPTSRSRAGPQSLVLEALCLLLEIISPKLRPVNTQLYILYKTVCRFPDLPLRKPLTYQAKQLIAREIELEKMRRTEALLHARNSGQVSGWTALGESKWIKEYVVRNHKQRLDQIVKRATFEEKVRAASKHCRQQREPEKNRIEKQIGKAVGQSDVWFRFNEGVSNAVRRNIYIKDLF